MPKKTTKQIELPLIKEINDFFGHFTNQVMKVEF